MVELVCVPSCKYQAMSDGPFLGPINREGGVLTAVDVGEVCT